MVEISHGPDKSCENCDRINETDEGPPYYKVPFVYGPEPRMAMEWWCGECVQEDDAFTVEDEELFLCGIEVEDVQQRYLDGENPDNFLDWPEP